MNNFVKHQLLYIPFMFGKVIELKGNQLKRTPHLLHQGSKRSDEDNQTEARGGKRNICCAIVDRSGKLWIGEEDGHIAIYDWLMRVN